MKIALVADWLPVFGGAEHVIAEFHRLWPDAPIFTTVVKRNVLGPLADADIRTTRLQHVYNVIGEHRVLLPWMPRAVESIDLRGYDVILSSSHAVGKGIIPPSSAVHICYCHTPMRYAWEMEQEYLKDFRIPKRLLRRVRGMLSYMRRWDMTTAARVDAFLANSSTTQKRIATIYGRESSVVIPPVDDRFFETPLQNERTSYLAVGRFVPYKRFDLLISAANAHHIPLTIVGTGPDEARLRALAGPTVTFAGFVPGDKLPSMYASAKAFLFPPLEDAGIVPLEAQACGTPVIAFGEGGALDTVIDGKTGLFFAEQTVESLKDAIDRFEAHRFDSETIRTHARQFTSDRFRKRIADAIQDSLVRYGHAQRSKLAQR